jgi:hypothetical protein
MTVTIEKFETCWRCGRKLRPGEKVDAANIGMGVIYRCVRITACAERKKPPQGLFQPKAVHP